MPFEQKSSDKRDPLSFFFSYGHVGMWGKGGISQDEGASRKIGSISVCRPRRCLCHRVMRVRARSYYYCNNMFREFIRQDTFATISNRNECNVTVMTGGRLEWGRQNSRTWGWQKPRVQIVFSEGNYVGVALSGYAIARRLTTPSGWDKIDSHD